MRSVMQHTFSQVPKADIPRSTFDRSHGYKTTFDAGLLIPFLVDEALRGDTFNCRVAALARLATPIVPIMDNMYPDTQFFSTRPTKSHLTAKRMTPQHSTSNTSHSTFISNGKPQIPPEQLVTSCPTQSVALS